MSSAQFESSIGLLLPQMSTCGADEPSDLHMSGEQPDMQADAQADKSNTEDCGQPSKRAKKSEKANDHPRFIVEENIRKHVNTKGMRLNPEVLEKLKEELTRIVNLEKIKVLPIFLKHHAETFLSLSTE